MKATLNGKVYGTEVVRVGREIKLTRVEDGAVGFYDPAPFLLVPEVGDGITVSNGRDSHAETVVSVSPSGKTFKATRDEYIRTDDNGMSESQEYTYTPDPQGYQYEFRVNKRGEWKQKGCPQYSWVTVGVRRAYHDFSF